MKIAILSASDKNLEYQYEITNKIKESYCKKYKYDFIFEPIGENDGNSAMYRYGMILRYLDSYDWVVWMDVDAWFNDFERDFGDLIEEYEGKHTKFMVCREDQSYEEPKKWIGSFINNGVLVCKGNDEDTKTMVKDLMCPNEFLETICSAYTNLLDQSVLCMKLIVDSFFIKHTTFIPQIEMNSFLRKDSVALPIFYDDCVFDRFILHAAGIKMAPGTTKNVFRMAINKTIEDNKLNIDKIPIEKEEEKRKEMKIFKNRFSG